MTAVTVRDGHVTGVGCRQERRLQRFETECEEQRVRQMKRQEKRAQATEDYLLKQRVQTQHCPTLVILRDVS